MNSKYSVVNRDPESGRNIGHDLTGVVFGKLRVVEETGRRCNNGYKVWRAICVCGEIVERPSYRFVRTPGRRSVSTTCRKCAVIGRPRNPGNESHINFLWNSVRKSAAERHIGFHLTKEEAAQLFEGDCAYCGSSPFLRVTTKNLAGMYAWNGIDRVDSDGSYVIGNVVSCCKVCNIAKNDMPLGEFEAWVARAYKHLHGRRKRNQPEIRQIEIPLTDRGVGWYFPSATQRQRRKLAQQVSPSSSSEAASSSEGTEPATSLSSL